MFDYNLCARSCEVDYVGKRMPGYIVEVLDCNRKNRKDDDFYSSFNYVEMRITQKIKTRDF